MQFIKTIFWLVFGIIFGLLTDDCSLPFSFRGKKKIRTQNLNVLIVGAGISGIAVAKVKYQKSQKNAFL